MTERKIDFNWGESVFAVNRQAMRNVRPEVKSPWPSSGNNLQNFSKKGGEQNVQNQGQTK